MKKGQGGKNTKINILDVPIGNSGRGFTTFFIKDMHSTECMGWILRSLFMILLITVVIAKANLIKVVFYNTNQSCIYIVIL